MKKPSRSKSTGTAPGTPATAAPRASRATRTPRKRAAGGPDAPAGYRRLYILSDSTGNLARHMLTSFLTQFPPESFQLQIFNFLHDGPRLDAAMDWIAREPGIVFHAVVAPQAKRQIEQRCQQLGLPVCDLTGRFVDFIARHSGLAPQPDRGRIHRVTEAYHRRIRAMEFTMQHDDGLGMENLGEADIILVGISRTSKTPTAMFLAQQGYKVANYALAMQVPPPPQLLEMPPNKVVGLLIDPALLAQIRRRRAEDWKLGESDYSDLDHVREEIRLSRRLFQRQGWAILDVSNQAVEETAARILNLLGLPAIKQ